ncbi:MAG: histone deacetylase family protein [Parvularculaceae bacterium]|nr:histone deacetylase family protein [Parvularculaceae bacterium]
MKAYFAEEQRRHYPESHLVNGVFHPNPEHPGRVDLLLEGARSAGCAIERPADCGLDPILAVHEERYVRFLKTAHERWRRIKGAATSVTPNIHPVSRGNHYPDSVVAQAGWHMLDSGAPIAEFTYEGARWSAACAVGAADAVLAGERAAYALCRPPGHHARQDAAAGFCYFNNTAIAATRLRSRHARVAVIDVDLHHGNGTQDIFYERDDVLTISIHADPTRFYPFFWGSDGERGSGAAEGFNVNYPLPRGSGDAAFLAALDAALIRVGDFAPGALVVALGLDAFEGDPFGGLSVTTGGFGRIGEKIAGAGLPTAIIQEGGYLCDDLGRNLAAFLLGFRSR